MIQPLPPEAPYIDPATGDERHTRACYNKKQRQQSEIPDGTCACGKKFKRTAKTPHRRWCGPMCRSLAYRDRRRKG